MSIPAGFLGTLGSNPSVAALVQRTVGATESLPSNLTPPHQPNQPQPAPTPKAATSIGISGPIPADAAYAGIADLRQDPTVGDSVFTQHGAWGPGEYVNIIIKPGDTVATGPTGKAYWDGNTWQTGQAPAPAPTPDSPDDTWSKQDIVDWLTSEGISCSMAMTKPELLALVP